MKNLIHPSTSEKNIITHLFLSLILILGLLLSGCNKDNSTAPEPAETTLSATEDAAESIASSVGQENGGLTDQVGDLMEIVSSGGMDKSSGTGGFNQVSRIYDPATGTWTLTLERERGIIGGPYYAMIYRVYTYQFLNSAGDPQQFYVTNGDTARTVNLNIVEGSGRHITPRISQELTHLSASFVATNAHLRNITVNGTYERAAVDTVTTRNAVRTLDHSISLTVTDLVGPRGTRRNLHRALSGTISGLYTAFVTFTRGDAYSERNIERSFTLTFGDSDGDLEVDSRHYRVNIETGELIQ